MRGTPTPALWSSMRRWLAFIGCIALLSLPAPLAGQPDEVRVVGRVVADSDGQPLEGASVTLLRHTGRTIARTETDAAGNFEFTARYVSGVRLRVSRLGYEGTTTPILRLDGRRFFQLEVRLDPEAILLAPLEVIAWSEVDSSPFLDNFRRRLRTGLGVYITRDQIDQRRPVFVTDLLRTVPGVHLEGQGSGSRPTISIGRTSGMDCVTQIFVDGFLVNRRGPGGVNDVRLDDVVSPGSVEAIEIYRGLGTVPPEFLNPDAGCGVVAVWTRRGGRVPRS